jgi:hypothetical protein
MRSIHVYAVRDEGCMIDYEKFQNSAPLWMLESLAIPFAPVIDEQSTDD